MGRAATPSVSGRAILSTLLAFSAACVLLVGGSAPDIAAGRGSGSVSSALDNGTIRVGIDLNAGGAISYLSPSGSSSNLVNIYDRGRYVQQSYYAGQNLDRASEGQRPMWSPWPWNPIQGGDTYGNASPVLAWSNDGRTIYVKTRPLLWDMKGEACECDFETWITLDGRSVRVRNRLTTFRTDSRWNVTTRVQELPAVYGIGDLDRVLTYARDRPFGYDQELMRIGDTGLSWVTWQGTEHWAACVNDQDFGFGVYSPPRTVFTGGHYGASWGGERDSPTCYLAPRGFAALDKTTPYFYKYYLTVGTLDQIRQEAYDLERRLAAGSTNEQTWGFNVDGNMEAWTPSASIMPAFVSNGFLRGYATDDNPYVVSPATSKLASTLKKVVVRLRNGTAGGTARIYFQTSSSPTWTRSKSKLVSITPYSDFAEYTLDMSGNPEWTGTITRLRVDPAAASGRFNIDWIRIAPAG